MANDNEVTPVIFRKWPKKEGGGILALFPAEPGTQELHTCSSYEHVGQHGSAHPHLVMGVTKRATPEEYADLKAELEAEPYRYKLKVYQRLQPGFIEARREALSK